MRQWRFPGWIENLKPIFTAVSIFIALVGAVLWATGTMMAADAREAAQRDHDFAQRCKVLDARYLKDNIGRACIRDGKVVYGR